jgi:hypothetical protein
MGTKISFSIPKTLPLRNKELYNCLKEIFFDLFSILSKEQLEQIWLKKAQCECLYQLFEFEKQPEPAQLKAARIKQHCSCSDQCAFQNCNDCQKAREAKL